MQEKKNRAIFFSFYLCTGSFIRHHFGQLGPELVLDKILLILLMERDQLLHVLRLKVADETFLLALVGREKLDEFGIQIGINQGSAKLLNGLLSQNRTEHGRGEIQGSTILDKIILEEDLEDGDVDELHCDAKAGGLGQLVGIRGRPFVHKLENVLDSLLKSMLQIFIATDELRKHTNVLLDHGGIIICFENAEWVLLGTLADCASWFYSIGLQIRMSSATNLTSILYDIYREYHQ